MVEVKMQVAHLEGMPRDFQDQIDLDDLRMIIKRFGQLPHVVAPRTCAPIISFLRWMLFCGCHHAKMDGRCEPLHLIINLENFI